jgi:Tfp pilus assembly pilus retraction ATPase PilT
VQESGFRAVVKKALEIDPDLSQIWLAPGRVPRIKDHNGKQKFLQGAESLTKDEINNIAKWFIRKHKANIRVNGNSKQGADEQDTSWNENEFDISEMIETVRWRIHIARCSQSWFIALRRLADMPWKLQKVGFVEDDIQKLFSHLESGLVVIAGPTAAGKTTTMAALANHLSETHDWMFTSAEYPIEYIIPDNRSLVIQREVRIDTESFHSALVASLRQTPNCIILGECRQAQELEVCLSAATTGHLVLTTLHASDLEEAILRMVGMYPTDQRSVVRELLASCLRLLLVQELVPSLNGDRMKMVWEAVKGTPNVRNLIRNKQENNLKNNCTNQHFRLIKHQLDELADNGVISSKYRRESGIHGTA